MRLFLLGLLSLIYVLFPGGLNRAGVINISNIRINDLSVHDGLKTITKTDTSQSRTHKTQSALLCVCKIYIHKIASCCTSSSHKSQNNLMQPKPKKQNNVV